LISSNLQQLSLPQSGTATRNGEPQQRGEKAGLLSAEDAVCIVKAALTFLADAGLEIAPKAAI
jgi:hypothetical protein